MESSNFTADRQFFSGIQVLRGFAALLVVIYHLLDAERIYGGGLQLLGGMVGEGSAGVDLFFVISGFVVVSIAVKLKNSPRNALLFVYRRAARILPMYWAFTTVIVAMIVLMPWAVDASFLTKSKLASYLLWPQKEHPLLQVGWTLIYEAFFYLVIAVFIGIGRTAERLPQYLATWALVVLTFQFLHPKTPVQQVFMSPLALEFIIGGAIGLYGKKLSGSLGWLVTMIGVLGFIGGMYVFSGMDGANAVVRVLIYGLSAGMIVLGLVAAESRKGIGRNPFVTMLVAIGDSSYSLYLSHLFVITIMARSWGRSGLNGTVFQHVVFIAATVGVSCLFAWVCYRLVERPVTRWLEGVFDRPEVAGAAVARS